MDRQGVVLAGGYSTRFGDRDKALAEVGGDPMLARVVARLGDATGTVVVNCRIDQREAFERALAGVDAPVRFAVDPVPDEGPLAGLATALGAVEAAYVAVAACDMPALDPDFVEFLFGRARGRDGAVPRLRDGTLQPAQAVYRRDAMAAAADRELPAGRRSLRGALDHLDAVVVSSEEVATRTTWRSLRDANTRNALDEFERGT